MTSETEEVEDVIVLGDLHLGAGDGADDFSGPDCNADLDLLEKIAEWRAQGEGIVLAGDILDLWQATLPEILAAHEPVIQNLFQAADAYVVGNHDEDMLDKKIYGLVGLPHLVANGIWIEHGHAHDPIVSRWPLISRAISALGGFLERYVNRDVDVLAARLAGWIGRTGRHGANERYVEAVAVEAGKHGCSRAVFGHTHQWMAPRDRLVLSLGWGPAGFPIAVANAGTWTNGKRDYVEIPEGGE